MSWCLVVSVFFTLLLELLTTNCQDLSVERTRSMAHLFSYIQCFPSNLSAMDGPSQQLFHTHQTFNPRDHLDEYKNQDDVLALISLVNELRSHGTPNDRPVTNRKEDIDQITIILKVLYHNADNWSLFYRTAVWLLHRVNTVLLWRALRITSLEKFGDVITASSVEVFPQLYAPKEYVLKAAGIAAEKEKPFPLQYWTSDPNLQEFHTQWHLQNPFWWNDTLWGVTRDRKGELLLYVHHQILARYQAELASNGIKDPVEPLGLQDDDLIPEGYIPDVVNANYKEFFSREDNKRIGDYGTELLETLRTWYRQLMEDIEHGAFIRSDGHTVSLGGWNGTDILGATTEPSPSSVNAEYYGRFHNSLHWLLSGGEKPEEFPIPGIQTHQETSMRDPVFYRIHARVDEILRKYKSTTTPYTQSDLDFPGISVKSVNIEISRRRSKGVSDTSGDQFISGVKHSTILTTYFKTAHFDISNAARPCRAVNDDPITVPGKILDHDPFSYKIVLASKRPRVAYGMVRIFLWPEFLQNGTRLVGDAAHRGAIELDRFRIHLRPNGYTVITRSSANSSVTQPAPFPGIKQLYNVRRRSKLVSNPNIRRACGFPNNLLIPRGTQKGMPFKLTVYVSDETDAGGLVEQENDSHFAYCGVVNGKPYPDKRSMGFPFDRPGTRFNVRGGVRVTNVKEFKVIIKHRE